MALLRAKLPEGQGVYWDQAPMRAAICDILQSTLLPTMSMFLTVPPGVVNELWSVLLLLPYQV